VETLNANNTVNQSEKAVRAGFQHRNTGRAVSIKLYFYFTTVSLRSTPGVSTLLLPCTSRQ